MMIDAPVSGGVNGANAGRESLYLSISIYPFISFRDSSCVRLSLSSLSLSLSLSLPLPLPLSLSFFIYLSIYVQPSTPIHRFRSIHSLLIFSCLCRKSHLRFYDDVKFVFEYPKLLIPYCICPFDYNLQLDEQNILCAI